MVEAGGGAPGVRPTEIDASAAETPARAEGARTETAPRGVQRSAAPSGVRLSLDALTVDALQAEVERGGLKAVVSVRRGDELLYRERVNFDWSGGREKFLRKSARALATAGVATRITEALLAEMRDALRAQATPPSDPVAAPARLSDVDK